MNDAVTIDETVYRPGKKTNLRMSFTPSGHGGSKTWQMQLTARNRGGGKVLATLWETTPLKPIGSVTIKGETYPLTIGRHGMKRGSTVYLGGERKTGMEGGVIAWEMECKPMAQPPDPKPLRGGESTPPRAPLAGTPAPAPPADIRAMPCFEVEARLRSTPRREGRVVLHIYTPLYRPEVLSLPSAAARGHCAMTAWSSYHKYAVGFVMLASADDEVGWEESHGGFTIAYDSFPFGGGKAIRFAIQVAPALSMADAKQTLNEQYAAVADALLHPVPELRALDPTAAVARYAAESAYQPIGIERLYPRAPVMPTPLPQPLSPAGKGEPFGDIPPDPGAALEPPSFYAGHPHYTLDMLVALWDWRRFHEHAEIPRLVRFGATGLAADFQVMGRADQAEPNKGAFWDKRVGEILSDYRGQPSHGISANARIARGLFLLYKATGDALFRQAAINICQWLILKHNDVGYYSGDRVHATLGQPNDGKVFGPHSLDGVTTIRPLVLAYHATNNEVYIKAARKIADYIGEDWLEKHEPESPTAAAGVITSLLALDAESPSERLRAVIRDWGAWLRVRPLDPAMPSANYDGLYGGMFDCAQAALRMHALESDPDYLRYGFAALSAIPRGFYTAAAGSIRLFFDALLSVASVRGDLTPDFDNLSVRVGWREFAPDRATESFLKVYSPTGEAIDYLPLVCRSNDQLLLITVAPPTCDIVEIRKNGKRPLVNDLFTGGIDNLAPLHPLIGEKWAKVGLFTIDP